MSNDFWSLILVFSLLVSIGSTVIFIFTVFTARNSFNKRNAIIWGSVAFLSFGMWIASLLKA